MKGVVLVNAYTQNEHELHQPRRICTELEALGAECTLLRNDFAPAHLADGICSELAAQYDFCVYLDKDRYAARLLEGAGMRLFNRAAAVEVCDDKLLTHIALAGVLPMPPTVPAPLCYMPGAAPSGALLERVEALLGYPVVVKECFGSLGRGVYLARDRAQLQAVAAQLIGKPHLFQKFISESAGQDVRVIVIGGRAVAAMRRVSKGDFRSNAELGGRGEPFALTPETEALCTLAARTLSLDYCGVDILLSREGPLVCEVNSNAFFGTFERVTGVNVAALYAQHIVSCMK